MMKKIRNAEELKHAKVKLELRELRLEKNLRNDWEEIRRMIHLNGSNKNAHSNGEQWLVSGLHTAAAALSKKLLEKAESKIEEGSNKAIHFIGERVNRVFGKKSK